MKELAIAREAHKLITNSRENTKHKAYRLTYLNGEIHALTRVLFFMNNT